MTHTTKLLLLGTLVPAALLATTAGGPIGHTGIMSGSPVDSNVSAGQTCQRCHNSFPVNSPGGHVRITAFNYRPGRTQTIRVEVFHPDAQRWGFQLTARQASDLTRRAGTFGLGGVRVRCSDTPAGRDVTAANPCPSENLEFAGHNPDIVSGGANGSKTFEVEWTPPSTDTGNVVFYAVGNAANFGTGNQGDRIFTENLEVEAEGRPCPNTIRPTLQVVRNAASGTNDVSWNTLISIFGRDFATSGTRRSAGRADLREGFPKELGCVAVEVNGERAPITFISHDQINAQVPTLPLTGSAQVRVITNPGRPNELRSDVANITMSGVSPAFFTFSSNQKNIAAVHQDGVIATDPAVVQGARFVRPGDIISLYATGLGNTTPVWQAGEMPDRIAPVAGQWTVNVGGTNLAAADVLYMGLTPGFISGLYQINIRVPMSVADGEVPVRLSGAGMMSPAGAVINVRR